MYNRFDIASADAGQMADRLGELEARKATLQAEIDATKAAILESGESRADGKRYAFTVVAPTTRESFSASKAKALLSAAQIVACTSTVSVKASVRIRARKA